eukprot:scaffold3028_cov174-Amphora_coffeaeformis.AAC.19
MGGAVPFNEVCGVHVNPDDALHLKETQVSVNRVIEPALLCVCVNRAVDGCTVAFVPQMIAYMEKIKKHINKFIMVIELYNHSLSSQYLKAKSIKL